MKNFLLIDDHQIVRNGIRGLLIDSFTAVNIHEAADAASAETWLKANEYDIVFMDVQILNNDMITFMQDMYALYPAIKVLVFSISAEKIYARRFLKAGAKGFLSKSASTEEIKKAINLVLNNRIYISETLGEILAEDIILKKDTDTLSLLSAREIEIASLLLSGASLTAICKLLGVQMTTVATHKQRLFKKMGIRTILELREAVNVNTLFNK